MKQFKHFSSCREGKGLAAMFGRFLLRKHIYEKFFENIIKQNKLHKLDMESPNNDFINHMLWWQETNEGHSFWENYNEQWRAEIEKYNNKKSRKRLRR